ncbi:TlpA family protein disulfide reductase [Weeksellaceae bacterium KMM 9713]|uniref:TlpA family protein disulfide reductase n=1 Tax=Profundicola chukchiensis TaxID=2961959 RepID=A0A9X4MY12_9FLAO|nr:TlpA disulfide reductase family protein [Profundicola chukchiensis]MDG4944867.1 TlpA family protein disulfide reductase [Profundicola chukchiensis]
MKKLIAVSFLAVASALNAQFDLNAKIKGYENKPVLVKIYENGSERLVKRVETDKQGNFKLNFPTAYIGKITFELSQGGFEVISANENISLTTDINDPLHKVHFDGGINQQIQDVFELDDKKSLRDFTLVELVKLYKPQDAFYQALQTEIRRIDNLEAKPISNEAIQYYIDAKNELGEYNANKFNAAQIQDKAKKHLVMDNMNLENFGLLQDFLSTYISYSIGDARTKQDAAKNIEYALDDLLELVQTDTSRGQAILTNIIPMLEGNGFNEMSQKYLSQAESLTCEITPDLQAIIDGKGNIEVGKVAPNIVFDKKIKKAKSLYDVKANQKLVVFWASWCPHCINELPHLKEFYKDFQKKGGEIVAIALDMDRVPYERAIEGTEWINYSDLMKWQSPYVKSYGITGTPTMILLDKDNKVVKIGSRVSEFL